MTAKRPPRPGRGGRLSLALLRRRLLLRRQIGTGGPPPRQEQPEVDPQVTHLRQAPLRTMVMAPHSSQASPS